MAKKRSVTVDLEEAEQTLKFWQAKLEADYDALRGNVKGLTAISSKITKWTEVVQDLSLASDDDATKETALKTAVKEADAMLAKEVAKQGGDARGSVKPAPKTT
jgi:hypothetical protein